MSNDAWIEQSLARLEQLETQKAQYEHAGQPAPAELAAEIRTLYEALEAAADDGEATEQPAPPPMAAASPVGGSPFDGPPADPFGLPPGAGASPPMQVPAMAPMSPEPMAMDGAYDDVDLGPTRSKAPMFLGLALVVAGLGGGGWYMTQQQAAKADEAAPQPTGEAKVIGASEVPEDTQEPDAAQGGSADRTEGTIWKKSANKPQRRSSGSRSGSRKRSKQKKDDSRKVEIGGNNRDPLAGLD